MGRSRQLYYVVNAERRRREEEKGRPGAIPLIGRGIRPAIPRFQQEGLLEESFYWHNMARERSRPFPTPQPFLQIHYRRQPHSLPCCLTGGFGHVAPNVHFPRVNNLPPQAPNPYQYVPPPPPPPPQDQESGTESSSSESSDSDEGNSLNDNCSTP